MSLRLVAMLVTTGCVAQSTSRESVVLDELAKDNYAWALREPALVALKLRKMQRGPYEWLRGTAALYWRDAMQLGAERTETAFGSPESSRVLLLGDAHVENIGTFRAADGTMFVDWNDFDGTGYGPYGIEVRRLAASFGIVAHVGAPADDALPGDLARAIATAYSARMAELASGAQIGAVGFGASALFDDELDKARRRGDASYALDELAPAMNGVRVLATGDLEAVAADGVLEDRVLEVTDERQIAWLDAAVQAWSAGKLDAAAAAIKLRARRIGSGVASYAAYRFQLVLEGPSAAVEDDILIELKETRDGLTLPGIWLREGAEWRSPASRSVDTQLRLQARRDADALLGHADVGALSLRIRDREAYQRGIDAEDLAALAASDRPQLVELARIYGAMLARAHGQALTADGVPGVTAIAPLLAGREAAFADEIVALSSRDASRILADHALMADRDLAAEIVGKIR